MYRWLGGLGKPMLIRLVAANSYRLIVLAGSGQRAGSSGQALESVSVRLYLMAGKLKSNINTNAPIGFTAVGITDETH